MCEKVRAQEKRKNHHRNNNGRTSRGQRSHCSFAGNLNLMRAGHCKNKEARNSMGRGKKDVTNEIDERKAAATASTRFQKNG